MKLLRLLLCLIAFPALSQIGPYSWQDHVSFNGGVNTVAKLGNYIYGSNYNGLVKVDLFEKSSQRKNKINGLSDVGIRLLRSNPYNNKLMVVYENCNIDILDQNDNVKNYPDIKLKTINGKKIINEVFFNGNLAYLSCGFGIILFDMEKMEIKETYIIGPNGTDLEVYQITMNDSLVFAATAQGLYKINYKTKILNNYNNWSPVAALPAGAYSGVVSINGKVLAAYSKFKAENIFAKDTIYALENNAWSKYANTTGITTVRKFGPAEGNILTIFDIYGIIVLQLEPFTILVNISTFNGEPGTFNDIVFADDDRGKVYWVADGRNGFYWTYGYYPFATQQRIQINGMNRNILSNIDVLEGKIAVSPSYPDEGGGTFYVQEGINIQKDGNWYHVREKHPATQQPVLDITHVILDRKDKTKMWASSWSDGLLEYKDDKLIAVYNASNTPMGEAYPGASRCSGLDMDESGNLWITNSDNKKYLSCRKKDGSFVSFTFDAARFVRRMMVDKNNYVWVLHERDQGITVYKNTNFAQPQLNVNYKILNKDVNSGALESNAVFSIAEDKDGKIWVGTNAGLRVFYNPTSIFSNSNFDAQPIKIVQDGNVELLLDKETVTAISVDGANNKWVGTEKGGLYCFSPDGQKELYHFTTDNSPLYSNHIIDLNYDEVTGDVFIGTLLGLQSFRSPVVAPEETYTNVHAFPNPVRPNYYGNVFVRGLVDNSVIKITDEAGNLVWETKSQGGQIEWPVKTLSGNRPASGVYVVYAATTTGEMKALTKVLVVN